MRKKIYQQKPQAEQQSDCERPHRFDLSRKTELIQTQVPDLAQVHEGFITNPEQIFNNFLDVTHSTFLNYSTKQL